MCLPNTVWDRVKMFWPHLTLCDVISLSPKNRNRMMNINFERGKLVCPNMILRHLLQISTYICVYIYIVLYIPAACTFPALSKLRYLVTETIYYKSFKKLPPKLKSISSSFIALKFIQICSCYLFHMIVDFGMEGLRSFIPTVSTFAVRETAALGIMGAPRVPPLNPSETIVLSEHYRL